MCCAIVIERDHSNDTLFKEFLFFIKYFQFIFYWGKKRCTCCEVLCNLFFSPSIVGSVLYRKLQGYLMTEEQLQEHGYPRTNPEAAGRAVIHNLPPKKANTDGDLHPSMLNDQRDAVCGL